MAKPKLALLHTSAPTYGVNEPPIQIFQPTLGREEAEAVQKVFESNWVGRGKITDQFEINFANFLGVDRKLVKSINSCTEGLFQSMDLLSIGKGDEVILPSISFVGAANAIAASGATPVFCDVDERTLNLTADFIAQKITKRTKAVMLLHYGGLPCELDPIIQLLESHKIPLIEDNACSVASKYKGRACGTFGTIGVWSFDAMKILVTGDGGMFYSRTPELAKRFGSQTYLGLTNDCGLTSQATSRWWEFDVDIFGRRSIMNDISSAIGVEQLKKLRSFINARKSIYDKYNTLLKEIAEGWMVLPPSVPSHMESSYYFYWIQLEPSRRDKLAIYLKQKGIYTTFRYYPLHRVKAYGEHSILAGSEAAADRTLCLPLHQALSDESVERVVFNISEFRKHEL